MAGKHPKERKIPKTLLKAKAFKSMENKVIMWVHVLELVVIMLVAAGAVTTAFFLNFFSMHETSILDNLTQPTMEKELETNDVKKTSVKEDTSVSEDTKTVDTVNKEDDEKQKDVKTNIER